MGRLLWIVLPSIVLNLGGVPLSTAQTPEESEKLERSSHAAMEAFNAYMQDDLDKAISLYRQSISDSSSADVIFDLARLYDQKQSFKLARKYYERYLADAGAEQDRSTTAKERLESFEAETALPSPPPPASQPEPPSPQAIATSSTVVDDDPPPSGRPMRLVGWSAMAIGAAALGTGVGLGISAKHFESLAGEGCLGEMCWSRRALAAAQTGNRMAAAATGLLVAGGTLTALGITLVTIARPSKEKRAILARPAFGQVWGATLSGRW